MSVSTHLPSRDDKRIGQARSEASAISAVLRLRACDRESAAERGAEAQSDIADDIREIAAWSQHDILAKTAALGTLFDLALNVGVPDPVLTLTGAGSLEVPWSMYIFRALTSDAFSADCVPLHAAGNRMAHAVFDAMVAVSGQQTHQRARDEDCEVRRDELIISREIPLGRAVDAKGQACACGHHCSLDLAMTRGDKTLSIEHKINAGGSDWTAECRAHGGTCGGKQSQVYGRLILGREPVSDTAEPELIYLSRTGKGQPSWTPFRHSDLATAFAGGLHEAIRSSTDGLPLSFGERYRACAFLLDLSSGLAGDLSTTFARAAEWRRHPDDTILALRLHQKSESSAVLAPILEALVPTSFEALIPTSSSGEAAVTQQVQPPSEAAQVLLRNYRQLLDAESQAYRWLEAMWIEVDKKLPASRFVAVDGRGWKRGKPMKIPSTKRSSGTVSRRPAFGWETKTKVAIPSDLTAELTTEVTIEVRAFDIRHQDHATGGQTVRVEACLNTKQAYSALCQALGRSKLLERQEKIAAREGADWLARPDDSRVLWISILKLNFDEEDSQRIVSELLKMTVGICDLWGAT